ncbi:hypothetical protein SAMN05421755_104821 [Nitrosomonas sp. Nm33]|nr:hypothetical protein SAMN05421755_104821 [Nitrosomonas sp. Nm33]
MFVLCYFRFANFNEPVIVNIEQVQKVCSLSYKTANDLVGAMCKHGILRETTGQSRNRVFVFLPIYRFLATDQYSKAAMCRQIEQCFDLSRSFQ